MKIKLVSFLGAFSAALLALNPGHASAHSVEAIIEFYNDINSRYYASEENSGAKAGYTDVKMSDKYRIESILSKVEEDPSSPFSHLAEYKFRDSVSYGNTLDADGFKRLVKDIYSAVTPTENTIRSAAAPSCEGDAMKSAESLICKGVGKESTVSSDGVRWYYSGNYVFSSEHGKLGVVIRSPRGMTKGSASDGCRYFTAKRFVSPTGVSSCGVSSDGIMNEEVLRLSSGGAFYVTCEDYSSPLLVYFSDKSKKADDAY